MMRLFFSLIVLLLLTPAAEAATHQVIPRTIDREVQARDILSEEITLINNKPHTINVFASVNNLKVTGEGDARDYTPTTESVGYKMADWLEISRGAQVLKAGASTTMQLRIAIPNDVEPGVYHAYLGFGSGRNRPIAEAAVLTGEAPGTILRLEIPEKIINQSELDKLSIDRFVFDREQEAVTYTVSNTSNEAVAPSGEVIIYNSRGAEIGVVPINPEGASVAAGAIMSFESNITALGLLGKYEAALLIDNKDLTASLSDTRIFYYLPWWQLLALIVILLVLSVLIYRRLHRSTVPPVTTDGVDGVLPVHVYQGESEPVDHDINLKQ